MLKVTQRNSLDRLKSLVLNPEWPHAVPPNQLCPPDSELEKCRRAEGIIELMMERSAKGCRVLDLGCGEGHTTLQIAQDNPIIGVGYDPVQQGILEWGKQIDNWILTNDWKHVEANGPYDIVLIYDVIDHMESVDVALDVMTKVHKLMDKKGRAFIRCHPWITRHGGHLYHQLNKAWIHLIFTDEELKSLLPGYTKPHVLKLLDPAYTYEKIFEGAGWFPRYQNQIPGNIEGFFRSQPKLAERIEGVMGGPRFVRMSHPFYDYILLTKKEY